MKKLTPLHARLNVIPRPDIANKMHGLDVTGGSIDTEMFGRVRIESPISYKTPAPRDSFAFGEVAAVGLPDEHWKGPPPCHEGDIIGFDLWQIGHEFAADSFYPNTRTFYTLPWRHALCRFDEGRPLPLADFVMVEPDDMRTRRWLGGSDGTLALPGSMQRSVGTNANHGTKVKGAVAKVISSARDVQPPPMAGTFCCVYNPLDAVTIKLPGIGERAFIRWSDIEQAVEDDD